MDVAIRLGDKSRTLRYTKRARYRLSKLRGESVGDTLEAVVDGRMDALCDLVWAGLLHEAPRLEAEAVADWIEDDRVGEILEAVLQALQEWFPQQKGDEGNPRAEPPSSGSASGPDA